MEPNVNNKDRLRRYSILIRIAFVILLLQNALLVIGVGYFIIGIFPIDLIGFLLLAGGYLLYSTLEVEHKRYYLIGGLCLLGWAICRVLYQYIILFLFMPQLCPHDYLFSFIQFFSGYLINYGCSNPPLWKTAMTISIFLGGLALALGSIAIWRTQKENWGHRIFTLYGVCNAIVISLFVLTGFGPLLLGAYMGLSAVNFTVLVLLLLKGFIIPLLGIIAFYPMLEGSKSTFSPTTAQLEGQDDLAGISSDHIEEEEEIFCPTCGQKIPKISRHCPYCGVGLEK